MQAKLIAAVVAASMACPVGAPAADITVQARQFAAQMSAPQAAMQAQGLDSASTCFDRARKLAFLAAGQGAPYVLKANFMTRENSGELALGTYTDTWMSNTKWRREAVLGKSRFVRSRNGRKLYRLAEGPDAPLLQYVLTAMEPLPATDRPFKEGDWRVKRDAVDGAPMTEVETGTPDAKTFRGFWFDASGQLLKTYGDTLETRRSDFRDFNGVKTAWKVDVLLEGKEAMRINVTDLAPAGNVDTHMFTIKRNDWVRQFTDEVR